jgi:hypothetical protein
MIIAFIIIVLHYIADFIFQSEEWAVNKSKSWTSLLKHTSTYSFLWLIFSYELFKRYEGLDFASALLGAVMFSVATMISHTATDYFTSRVTSRLFAEKNLGGPIPNLGAFSMIGFDQVIHYWQLFATYSVILKYLTT